jgi:integrase
MARRRRGRGEGNVIQRDDGRWMARLSSGNDPLNGKRRRETVYGATREDVQGKLLQLRNEAANGTLGNATVEPNTYGPYERHVRLHITPNIGSVKLRDLTGNHVNNLYAKLTEAKTSTIMQRKIGTTLTIALGQAVRERIIPHNAAEDVKKPKEKKGERKEIRPLAPAELTAFLNVVSTDRLHAFYLTALDSGMRPGELFALQWSDLDFDASAVTVTKSLEEIGGALRVKDVKTSKSRRRIDLTRRTVAALHEHRKTMLAAGHAGAPVFCDTDGGYLRIGNVTKRSFQPAVKAAGLGHRRLYDLRHTCATLLLLADVNPKVVSERLGHSSITLTLNTYSHVLPMMGKRAAEKMNTFLGG